jgi:hypothetical protein
VSARVSDDRLLQDDEGGLQVISYDEPDMLKWMVGIREKLAHETAHGGELKDQPCPFCGLPRCLRSCYIRCQKCGLNWGPDDDKSRDPRLSGKPVARAA